MANTTNQGGYQGFSDGAIFDQTQLLQDIISELDVYNLVESPYINMFTRETIRQTERVAQGPKSFGKAADGARAENKKMVYRLLNVPFNDWDLSSEFTVKWLQDALASDVRNELQGAMAGDVELCDGLFFQACLTSRTVGAIGTAYQAGFYNGETDVPPYKENGFTSAHYHYQDANSTTLTLAIFRAMKADIQEHGYGLMPGDLHLFFNSAQEADVMALSNSNAATTILQAATPERVKMVDQGVVGVTTMIEGVVPHMDDNVPSGYCMMLASDVAPLLKRVHIKPEYRGLNIYSEVSMPEYPLAGMQFLRRIGFSVGHMGAGTVRRLIADPNTYTSPTFRIAA